MRTLKIGADDLKDKNMIITGASGGIKTLLLKN